MNSEPDSFSLVDERIERLICRVLDGEASHAESVELEAILAHKGPARDLYDSYLRNDALVVTALRAEMARVKPAVAVGRRRGLWLATACAIGAAAAVIAFSLIPTALQSTSPNGQIAMKPEPQTQRYNSDSPEEVQPSFADYTDSAYSPHRRQRSLVRDLIGVRGDDKNVIYIYETNTQSTRLVPVSGSF
jgi:hypothetical protein